VAGDGYGRGCGRYPAGRHFFRVVSTPGWSGRDRTTNEVDIARVDIARRAPE
jgi:hypothetical protein